MVQVARKERQMTGSSVLHPRHPLIQAPDQMFARENTDTNSVRRGFLFFHLRSGFLILRNFFFASSGVSCVECVFCVCLHKP